MSNVGTVILAGGRSHRMGRDKAGLRLEGKTFLQRLIGEMDGFDEVLLSVDSTGRYLGGRLRVVEDLFPDCGPIGGLYSALIACKSEWLMAVSCDMPLFTYGLAEYLISYISGEYDAIVAETQDGRTHPLCAVYRKTSSEILSKRIESGNYRMLHALKDMRVKTVSLRHSAYSDELLQNINTPEQYQRLYRKMHGLPIIAISGVKNSGKTTILEGILPLLRERGLRVAVIKHDGHDFIPDVPGTDSYRLRQAGAYGVAVYSDYRYMLTAELPDGSFEKLARQFSDADLILLEGGKHTAYPKLEVVRAAISDTPVCAGDSLIGICTDTNVQLPVHIFHIDDYKGIAELLLRHSSQKEEAPCVTATDE